MSGAFIVKSRLDGQVVHPGVILLQHFMDPAGISQNELAYTMGVPPRRINEIVHGKRAITADTAIRLQEVLAVSAEYWMYLQADFELEMARLRGALMPSYPRGSYRKKWDPEAVRDGEAEEIISFWP